MSAPRPTPGPAAPFRLPPRDRRELPGGVPLTLVRGGSVPKVEIRVTLDTGAVDEPGGAPWTARFAFEYLKEGIDGMDAAGVADAFARLGGDFGAGGGEDTSTVIATALSEHAAEAARLLCAILRRPAFPATEEARLLADLRRARDVAEAEPGTLAAARFLRAIYREHPYGRGLPTAAQVGALRCGGAAAFYADRVGAARARVYAGGPCDADALAAALSAGLDGWGAGPAPARRAAEPRPARRVFLVDRPGAEQSTIYLGLPAPSTAHAEFVPFLVLNTLVGGAFYSRVTRNIREDKGYAYSPRSAVAAKRGCAHWVQVADVTTAVTGAALAEIRREIDRLREEAPGEEELAGIRNYLAGSHVLSHAAPSGVLDHIAFLDFHGLDEEWSRRYVERVHAVTPEDVRRLAQEHLRPEEMTLSVAGDAATVRAQLEPWGEVVVG